MKAKIGVIFGGKSVEHEISIITANQAIEGMDREKYEIIPIYITKNNLFYTGDALFDLQEYRNTNELLKKCTQIILMNDGKNVNLIRYPMKKFGENTINTIDIAFPIMHGTNGEDGTIQGFLQMLNIPYIGPDVLASSVGMDKIIMRKVLKESGLPVLDYVAFYSMEYIKDEEKYKNEIESKIGYPVIVKAGNLGSSIGIKKASNRTQLEEAIEFSMQFSDRVMVEKAIENLREINCSVLGNISEANPSVCEEPLGAGEILSYTDKYVGGGKNQASKTGTKVSSEGMASLQRRLPADISQELTSQIQNYALETFKILGVNGVSRIDFLLDCNDNSVYVNEINTIPGALSYYLWEATGKSFKEEIDCLVDLALKRERQKEKTIYSYDQNILSLTGGGKLGTKGTKISKK